MVTRATPEEYFKSNLIELNVGSKPIVGVPFILDGVERVTPFACLVSSSNPKTVEVFPEVVFEGKTYKFREWSDGSTSLKREVSPGKSYIMVYEEEKREEAKPIFEEEKAEEQPKIVYAQETAPETPLQDYTPIIVAGLIVLGIVAICYFAYLSRKG